MAEMTMNQLIHHAVRRDLARTESALRSFPDGDRARALELQRAWRNLVRELTHHHEAEDANIWPFLLSRGVDASLLEAMEAEHRAMKDALGSASERVDSLVATPTTEAAAAAAELVARAKEVTDRHLAHEEEVVEPLLLPHQDDPEWKTVAKRLRPTRLADLGDALAWIQDGAGPRELAAMRSAIPGPVVTVMTALLGRRSRREVAPAWR